MIDPSYTNCYEHILLLGSKAPKTLMLNKGSMTLHNEACMGAKTISKTKSARGIDGGRFSKSYYIKTLQQLKHENCYEK
jgi:hypothetical protein